LSIRFIFILLITTIGVACSSLPSDHNKWHHARAVNETISHQGNLYQVIDSETENIEQIKETKLTFSLTHGEDILAWERLVFYFNFYLKSPVKILIDQPEVEVTVNNFDYIIKRKRLVNSVDYNIKVIDKALGKTSKESTLKAKNLARFLSQGILDQNIL
jgi:hypothetical protein